MVFFRLGTVRAYRVGNSKEAKVANNQRWEVLADTNTGRIGTREGWKPVYCTSTLAKAKADAARWTAETGQVTAIVPGPGHKSRAFARNA